VGVLALGELALEREAQVFPLDPRLVAGAPRLQVDDLHIGDPLAVALSINVGSSLVDVSPLSTLGALCLATVSDGPAARLLFRRLLIWGLSMTLVGAALCQLFAGPFARW